MAIRKFRKIMKPFTIVISFVFVLSLVYGGYQSFKTSSASKKAQQALKLNGKVISKYDIERAKNELANQYSTAGIQVDKSLNDIIAFNQVIDKNLTLDLAKKLKIKVPSSEVEEQYKQIENSIGDRDQFRRMLEFQGLSKESYKAKLEEELLLSKTVKAFSDEINPTEEETQKYYDTVINNRNVDFESVKEQIIEELKTIEGIKKFTEALNKAKKEATIKDLAQEYEGLVEAPLYEEEGFTITNLDFASQTLHLFATVAAVKSKEEAEKLAKDSITKQIKMAKVAQEKGITVSEDMGTLDKFADYQIKLLEKYREEIKPTEADLKAYFNANTSKYEIKASADANFAFVDIKPSKEDEDIAKERAEEVLKAVNKENFEDFGRDISKEDGYLYEDLGTFSKGMMVKEFEDALKATESGSIAKNVVKTTFGYHIIYVKENNKNESWTASHILVRVIPSEKTIAEKMEKLNKIKDDINAGTIAFSEIPKLDEDIVQSILIKGITPDGLIPNLGYSPEVAGEIFANPLNEAKVQSNGQGVLLFQKIKEVKAEKADFTKSQETVKNDYINFKAEEAVRKLYN